MGCSMLQCAAVYSVLQCVVVYEADVCLCGVSVCWC